MKTKLFLSLVLIVLLSACSDNKPTDTESSKEPPSEIKIYKEIPNKVVKKKEQEKKEEVDLSKPIDFKILEPKKYLVKKKQVIVEIATKEGAEVLVKGQKWNMFSEGVYLGLIGVDIGENKILIEVSKEGRGSKSKEITITREFEDKKIVKEHPPISSKKDNVVKHTQSDTNKTISKIHPEEIEAMASKIALHKADIDFIYEQFLMFPESEQNDAVKTTIGLMGIDYMYWSNKDVNDKSFRNGALEISTALKNLYHYGNETNFLRGGDKLVMTHQLAEKNGGRAYSLINVCKYVNKSVAPNVEIGKTNEFLAMIGVLYPTEPGWEY